ncbi:MAG: phage integrase N-terminal SAM-like domain-containing protein, partial [Candidatus Rokubacteria bacterium]|nr:phage integrase N-terminal SAM-like domain-containing protein [Candidatus Rokubacteria bacterium]
MKIATLCDKSSCLTLPADRGGTAAWSPVTGIVRPRVSSQGAVGAGPSAPSTKPVRLSHYGKRHPAEMGAPEISGFLSWLAVDGKVAASTQNQALSALLFLYQEVLDLEVPWLDDIVRAKRPQR